MQKKTARIEDWAKLGNALVGIVFYDGQQQALPPGKLHRTSRILKLTEHDRICETRNTIYRLGAAFRPSPETR
jgi:hypothetical protein